MPPAARIGDMHTCPMVDPGPKPHVGGPVATGAPTVLIGGQPAARVGDMATCAGPPDSIVKGAPTVTICGQMAARIGDNTAHGGVVVAGCPTVLVGEVGLGGAQAGAMSSAKATGAALVPCNCDKAAAGGGPLGGDAGTEAGAVAAGPPMASSGLLGTQAGRFVASKIPLGYRMMKAGVGAARGGQPVGKALGTALARKFGPRRAGSLWDLGSRLATAGAGAHAHGQSVPTALRKVVSRSLGHKATAHGLKSSVKGAAKGAGIGVAVGAAIGGVETGLRHREVWEKSKADFSGRVAYGATRSAVSSAASTAAGAAAGAVVGAIVGSILPGPGTVAGAIIGAKVGAFVGGLAFAGVGEWAGGQMDKAMGAETQVEAETKAGGVFKGWFGAKKTT